MGKDVNQTQRPQKRDTATATQNYASHIPLPKTTKQATKKIMHLCVSII
ncbi:MAG: hypothetical protein NTZ59_05990 [Bacteroidetes bacterium]|jgi:hemoglobin-like flavoprotein|nr:hypothetical protein [Bacteroidota bacterium]